MFLRGQPVPWTIDPVSGLLEFRRTGAGAVEARCDTARPRAFFHTARIAANEPLRESMSARTRTGYALKTLLGDRETAQQACELASVLSSDVQSASRATDPSTHRLVSQHARNMWRGHSGLNIDVDDDAENMSVYIADWLRGLAQLPDHRRPARRAHRGRPASGRTADDIFTDPQCHRALSLVPRSTRRRTKLSILNGPDRGRHTRTVLVRRRRAARGRRVLSRRDPRRRDTRNGPDPVGDTRRRSPGMNKVMQSARTTRSPTSRAVRRWPSGRIRALRHPGRVDRRHQRG